MLGFPLRALPAVFPRIRHYGLFANGHRAAMIARCRELLDAPPTQADGDGGQGEQRGATTEVPACPCCGGAMQGIERFAGASSPPRYPWRKADDRRGRLSSPSPP